MCVELRAMLQRIFDDVSTHLMKQYKQCSAESEGCLYRDGNGNSCAIGGIIKEEFYNSSLERAPASHRKVLRMIANSGYGQTEDLELIDKEINGLQLIHDSFPEQQWFIRLHKYALDHSLNQDTLINAAKTYKRIASNWTKSNDNALTV